MIKSPEVPGLFFATAGLTAGQIPGIFLFTLTPSQDLRYILIVAVRTVNASECSILKSINTI